MKKHAAIMGPPQFRCVVGTRWTGRSRPLEDRHLAGGPKGGLIRLSEPPCPCTAKRHDGPGAREAGPVTMTGAGATFPLWQRIPPGQQYPHRAFPAPC